jgi:uncharacterized protein YdiU (UPF0061 family)
LFHSHFRQAFPGDETGDLRPRQTPGVLWSAALPTPVSKPRLLGWSEALAGELRFPKPGTEAEMAMLGGNALALGMAPYANCYGGHQFGNWAGQLGDGRAITLGEWESPDGRITEFHLKGAGETAYSRRGDGRAVLRSSMREYLMSEAMHHLGVPTTRALSLIATGDAVVRDMFYDGNAKPEAGAIVLRTAPSFLRFGSFEILAARGEHELLAKLVDWTIEKHYPHITGADKRGQWLTEVVRRTAQLAVEWMRVGFVHGVLNTDNMSILGLTIDYGPYSMLDAYDQNFTPNTTDLPGRRYAFGKQLEVVQWNLLQLANALVPLWPTTEPLVEILKTFGEVGGEAYVKTHLAKMGITEVGSGEAVSLLGALEKMLQLVQPDYTLFFLLLEDLPAESLVADAVYFEPALYGALSSEMTTALDDFCRQYRLFFAERPTHAAARQGVMRRTNPQFVLRNYLLHEAAVALEAGDDTLFRELEAALQKPYENPPAHLALRQPNWARTAPGCGMLSCSS